LIAENGSLFRSIQILPLLEPPPSPTCGFRWPIYANSPRADNCGALLLGQSFHVILVVAYGYTLSATQICLSLCHRKGLHTIGDVQGEGAATSSRRHQASDDRDDPASVLSRADTCCSAQRLDTVAHWRDTINGSIYVSLYPPPRERR